MIGMTLAKRPAPLPHHVANAAPKSKPMPAEADLARMMAEDAKAVRQRNKHIAVAPKPGSALKHVPVSTPRSDLILDLIDDWMTAMDVAEVLGGDPRKARGTLRRLVGHGLAEQKQEKFTMYRRKHT